MLAEEQVRRGLGKRSISDEDGDDVRAVRHRRESLGGHEGLDVRDVDVLALTVLNVLHLVRDRGARASDGRRGKRCGL